MQKKHWGKPQNLLNVGVWIFCTTYCMYCLQTYCLFCPRYCIKWCAIHTKSFRSRNKVLGHDPSNKWILWERASSSLTKYMLGKINAFSISLRLSQQIASTKIDTLSLNMRYGYWILKLNKVCWTTMAQSLTSTYLLGNYSVCSY